MENKHKTPVYAIIHLMVISTCVLVCLLACFILLDEEPDFTGSYLFNQTVQLPPSVSVASILIDGKVVETVRLSPKCTLSTESTIQLVKPLLGDLAGSGVYRIDKLDNSECPDKRFYVTMPLTVADELIKGPAQKALTTFVTVASIPTDRQVAKIVKLSPKCSLSNGSTIEFVRPLFSMLAGDGIYRIEEPSNSECPDKIFFITMPFKVADELIKNGAPLVRNVTISKQETATILEAEPLSSGGSQ